ncbi:25021_t:CDS:2 [Dentiscutata erythropus]|uniref:25021_t:CDS:1 n=1 Tax=Dentiscutata erythropus TaxID=1348616 RepID=A0A9N9ABN7_9GLOM|nr:25021_t:CDS:2 [Dentiscutata erythropus]
MKDIVNLRIDLISDCRQMAIIFMKNFPNLDNSQMFKFICNVVINNLHLTQHEKNYLIFDLIITRDSQNIIEEIGERRLCKYCNSKVLANGPYIEWDTEQQILKRGGKGTYILKRLNNSNKVIENISIEKYSQSLIRCYGFTKDPTTRNYMLVLQHMDSNLRDYLTKKPDLPWKIIFKIVRNISNGIRKLHKLSNSAHKNLHPRNILVDEAKFHFDEFASDIINGLRPKVVDGTPLDYTALMVKCWDAIPENRPDANIVMKEMESLLRNIYENDDINRELKPIPLNIDTKMPVKNLIKCLVRKFNRLGCLCKK